MRRGYRRPDRAVAGHAVELIRRRRRRRRTLAGTVLESVAEDQGFALVDVGAGGGLEPAWRGVEERILAIGFEPDERAFEQLESSARRRYFPVALWERSEPLTLYQSRGRGKSSVLRPRPQTVHAFPNPERLETVEEISLPQQRVQSLDRILVDNGIHYVDFIKLDTQGSELSILRGGSSILATAAGLKVEVGFVELYEGQPLFADVDAFVRRAGFELMDLKRGYWKRNGYTAFPGRGQLVAADALYFRDQDVFLAGLEDTDPAWAQNAILKFVVVCLIYGMHDYAVTLLAAAHEREMVEGTTYRRITEAIAAHDRRMLFSGGPTLSPKVQRSLNRGLAYWREAERRIDPGHEGWAHGDRFLGNR